MKCIPTQHIIVLGKHLPARHTAEPQGTLPFLDYWIIDGIIVSLVPVEGSSSMTCLFVCNLSCLVHYPQLGRGAIYWFSTTPVCACVRAWDRERVWGVRIRLWSVGCFSLHVLFFTSWVSKNYMQSNIDTPNSSQIPVSIAEYNES